MNLYRSAYQSSVSTPRNRRLALRLAGFLPKEASVVDVGCGDGLIDKVIQQHRPDVGIRGLDILIRPETHIPVERFDGSTLPLEDGAADVVMFNDMLHHTGNPLALLREGARVAGHGLLIKDHLADGFLARPTLRFMDFVGNAQHGVVLPFNYWTRAQWDSAFTELRLTVEEWITDVGLYPAPASWVFGRNLHFIAYLDVER